LMFYDFAPHGDGANNGMRAEDEPGPIALCLLFLSECMVPRVVKVVSARLDA